MNRASLPQPPAELLARCLDTIPASAKESGTVPRLFPDAGSRRRLVWLAAAAAVPVVTVLAVLPINTYLKARQKVAPESITYIRTHKTFVFMDTNSAKPQKLQDEATVSIKDIRRGVISYPARRDNWKPISPFRTKIPRWNASLILPSGKSYAYTNASLKEYNLVELSHQGKMPAFDWQKSVLDSQNFAADYLNSYQPSAGAVRNRREDRWEGRTVERIETTTTRPGDPGTGKEYVSVVRVYVDKKTNLILTIIHYVFVKKNGEKRLQVSSLTKYYYDRRPGDEKFFDVAGFKSREIFRW